MEALHPKYVTDDTGKKVAVLLPIDEYEEMLEDLHDLAVMAERKNEPQLSHEEVVAQLKESGHL